MLVVDGSLLSTVEEIEEPFASVEEVVAIASKATGRLPYDELLARGSDDARDWNVEDERATITINYTSGTDWTAERGDVHPPRCVPERAG